MKLRYGTTVVMKYCETDHFNKDLKKLLKRFKTLESDLETAKKHALENFHLNRIDNKGIVQIPKIGTQDIQVYKVRKFACRALKNRGSKTGIRIIYAFHVKTRQVDFLEIYFKADQANENQQRILDYLDKKFKG